MAFCDLPPRAAWRHRDARDGFEVVFFRPDDDGHHIRGCTSAVENGEAWAVRCELEVDAGWSTRTARVLAQSTDGHREVTVVSIGPGRWLVDGVEAPHLDGCLDVDLESSAMTNAFPVRRLGLEVGQAADAPAVYVRAPDLGVERLDQRYVRLDDADGRQRYDYAAPVFDFRCELVYDAHGLVTSYPGLAVRVT